MAIDLEYFQSVKDKIKWEQVKEWQKGQGAVSHLIWKGRRLINNRYEDIPAFFLYISADKSSGKVKVSLGANVNYNMQGSGQKVIDSTVAGGLSCFQDGSLEELLHSRYGLGGQAMQVHNVGRYNPALSPKYQKAFRTLIKDRKSVGRERVF